MHHTCTCMSPKQLVNLSMIKTSVPEVDINKWLCVKWVAFYPNLSKRKVCSSQTAMKSNLRSPHGFGQDSSVSKEKRLILGTTVVQINVPIDSGKFILHINKVKPYPLPGHHDLMCGQSNSHTVRFKSQGINLTCLGIDFSFFMWLFREINIKLQLGAVLLIGTSIDGVYKVWKFYILHTLKIYMYIHAYETPFFSCLFTKMGSLCESYIDTVQCRRQ